MGTLLLFSVVQCAHFFCPHYFFKKNSTRVLLIYLDAYVFVLCEGWLSMCHAHTEDYTKCIANVAFIIPFAPHTFFCFCPFSFLLFYFYFRIHFVSQPYYSFFFLLFFCFCFFNRRIILTEDLAH